MHLIRWALLLCGFWLLLSGFIQPLLLSFGVISVALVIITLKRMDAADSEPKRISIGSRIIFYCFWLLGQIVLSAIQVTKLIWGGSHRLSPTIARIPIKQVTHKNRVLYANSITLTPGTLSVDLQDNEVVVHALQQSSIDELQQGDMEKMITGRRS
ncbi:cation transporter [Saccharobesus litoralis]|uniref:Cation transporter n=1 Tax=Saccharobesus litoralis TaxID=2172099 RepID=A0A2S0VQG2_9ALTE|nr:Na+/H+ antiporter subunit E [Saccharobesus litoralis]AWB66429.1 cation transporter [Saccharobesus litoralis]